MASGLTSGGSTTGGMNDTGKEPMQIDAVYEGYTLYCSQNWIHVIPRVEFVRTLGKFFHLDSNGCVFAKLKDDGLNDGSGVGSTGSGGAKGSAGKGDQEVKGVPLLSLLILRNLARHPQNRVLFYGIENEMAGMMVGRYARLVGDVFAELK